MSGRPRFAGASPGLERAVFLVNNARAGLETPLGAGDEVAVLFLLERQRVGWFLKTYSFRRPSSLLAARTSRMQACSSHSAVLRIRWNGSGACQSAL
jgi:hypothetical protein